MREEEKHTSQSQVSELCNRVGDRADYGKNIEKEEDEAGLRGQGLGQSNNGFHSCNFSVAPSTADTGQPPTRGILSLLSLVS